MPNRNSEINTSSLPALFTNRSRHHYYKNIKTTFNEGMLTPFYANELVQPSDTFNIIMSFVARTQTPLQPVMDNAYYDFYLFSMPWLDVWDNAKAFWGENPNGAWINQVEYVTPRITVESTATIGKHDILNYFGFRQGQRSYDYTVGGGLSVKVYVSCWNEYFRDENYIAPIQIDKSDATTTFDSTYAIKGGECLKVAKFHDRFTSGLPEPSGNTVGIPLGTSAPVIGTGKAIGLDGYTSTTKGTVLLGGLTPPATGGRYQLTTMGAQTNTDIGTTATAYAFNENTLIGLSSNPEYSGTIADLSNAISATLNAQRIAIALNHIEERLGMYGRRYREIVKSAWFCDTSDLGMHIPEYLGGKRVMANMNQVVNSTEGTTNAELGSTGGYSLTSDVFELCNKSFTEHSVLMGVMCYRTEQHNGVQGMPRQYLKSRKYDYYWDDLAGLGFQPIYNGELLWQGTSEDMEAHHFLPSWEEYRSETDIASGEFAPDYSTWLKEWTYARKLENLPVMGQTWIEEDTQAMDRTLKVTSEAGDNIIMDIQLEVTKYSITKQHGLPGINKF